MEHFESGHLFFTDTQSPEKTDEEDFIRVEVPTQRVKLGKVSEKVHTRAIYSSALVFLCC